MNKLENKKIFKNLILKNKVKPYVRAYLSDNIFVLDNNGVSTILLNNTEEPLLPKEKLFVHQNQKSLRLFSPVVDFFTPKATKRILKLNKLLNKNISQTKQIIMLIKPKKTGYIVITCTGTIAFIFQNEIFESIKKLFQNLKNSTLITTFLFLQNLHELNNIFVLKLTASLIDIKLKKKKIHVKKEIFKKKPLNKKIKKLFKFKINLIYTTN
uniref:Orf211 n=1 Tax=Ochromonas danica TaxID=2986 RepID=Q9G914_OCHDN|nr:orf211 [Ochromonas danica]AAG18391.1 orf211 [Ochromonas danica]